jgi:hypothetical protein
MMAADKPANKFAQKSALKEEIRKISLVIQTLQITVKCYIVSIVKNFKSASIVKIYRGDPVVQYYYIFIFN